MAEYKQRRTSARPQTIDGVTFECWNTGIMQTEWRSQDGQIVVRSNSRKTGYHAWVAGEYIWTGKKAKRFMTQKNAMAAGIKALKERATNGG